MRAASRQATWAGGGSGGRGPARRELVLGRRGGALTQGTVPCIGAFMRTRVNHFGTVKNAEGPVQGMGKRRSVKGSERVAGAEREARAGTARRHA